MGWFAKLFAAPDISIVPPKPPVANHRLDDNLQSATSGPWKKSDTCPHCKNDVSHREWMAKICETCGMSVNYVLNWRHAASRRVVRDGRWVTQRRINGVNYLSTDGQTWAVAKDTPAVSQAQEGNAAAEPRSLLKNPNPERETG